MSPWKHVLGVLKEHTTLSKSVVGFFNNADAWVSMARKRKLLDKQVTFWGWFYGYPKGRLDSWVKFKSIALLYFILEKPGCFFLFYFIFLLVGAVHIWATKWQHVQVRDSICIMRQINQRRCARWGSHTVSTMVCSMKHVVIGKTHYFFASSGNKSA